MTAETFLMDDNLCRLAEELRTQERKILDFKTPSNPLGVSKKIKAELRKHLKYLHNYPDPEAGRLRRRIAQHHGIDPGTILCGGGRMELLSLTARALGYERVLIAGPYDPAYEKACRLTGTEAVWYDARDPGSLAPDAGGLISLIESSAPALICLSNPDGLTGLLFKGDEIQRIADSVKRLNRHLVVDEALIDFCPEKSAVREVAGNPSLIVLRTMSFFYSLAGLRIAYGVFPTDVVEIVRNVQVPFTVNRLAQRAAAIALKDDFYRRETSLVLREEKQFMEKGFRRLGIDFRRSDVNFYLLKIDGALEVYKHLRGKGLLLGYYSPAERPSDVYLKAAVKTHRANAVLMKELTRLLDGAGIQRTTAVKSSEG